VTETAKIRIVCVDDSAETRALFGLLMSGDSDLETVDRLGHTTELEPCIATARPDVVVLDLWMPGQDPMAVMRDAKARMPVLHFLVLSSDDDPAQIERAFENGATGYAIKDGNFERLVAAIREVAAGHTVRPAGGARNSYSR
jgi:DNA-binding NarL/FixJ family response regulator